MTEEDTDKTVIFQEILVAVDTSAHSQAALEAAAALARTMEANIHGVFVYDELWNRISRLPSVTAVNAFTGQISPFEDDTLENQIKLLKNRLRQKLEYTSRRYQITHTWHFARGNVDQKILEAAEKADLITIGLRGTSAGRKILGTSARRISREADKPVLILKEGLRLGATISAVYDGSEEGRKGIEMALSIAEKNESTLTVLVVGYDQQSHEQQNKELENLLRDSPVFVEIEILGRANLSRFINSVNKQKSGLLIVPKNQPLLTKSLQTILNHINCPLLMAK